MLYGFIERSKAAQHFKGADVPDPAPPPKPPKPPAPSDAAENLKAQRLAKAEKERRGFRSTIYTRGILNPGLIQQATNNSSILGG